MGFMNPDVPAGRRSRSLSVTEWYANGLRPYLPLDLPDTVMCARGVFFSLSGIHQDRHVLVVCGWVALMRAIVLRDHVNSKFKREVTCRFGTEDSMDV